MTTPLERARAYLEALEVDRRAALALSEQQAEKAKVIKARQEGFQTAMEMFGGGVSIDRAGSLDLQEPRRRRTRRHVPQLILRELSFSGQPITTSQIAKAINYNPERTETALERLEKAGQVLRNGRDRWESASQPSINSISTL
jgi:predicted transcriptional regulator